MLARIKKAFEVFQMTMEAADNPDTWSQWLREAQAAGILQRNTKAGTGYCILQGDEFYQIPFNAWLVLDRKISMYSNERFHEDFELV